MRRRHVRGDLTPSDAATATRVEEHRRIAKSRPRANRTALRLVLKVALPASNLHVLSRGPYNGDLVRGARRGLGDCDLCSARLHHKYFIQTFASAITAEPRRNSCRRNRRPVPPSATSKSYAMAEMCPLNEHEPSTMQMPAPYEPSTSTTSPGLNRADRARSTSNRQSS